MQFRNRNQGEVRARLASSTRWASVPMALLVVGCLAPGAFAQDYWEEYVKVAAPDPRPEDEFGKAVVTDGVVALIGAPGDSREVEDAGSVHVFDIASQTFMRRLTAATPAFREHFGSALAIEGALAVIGAPTGAGREQYTGVVYIVDWTTGVQVHRLIGSDSHESDRFGDAVAIDDGLVVVGAWNAYPLDVQAGEAYVFDAVTGEEIQRLILWNEEGYPDSTASQLGYSVAIRGELVALGSPEAFVPSTSSGSGAVFLFDARSGNYLRRIDAPITADDFALDLDVEGDRILIGSGRENYDNRRRGGAHLFDLMTGMHLQVFVPESGWPSQGLGSRVDLRGNLVLLGAERAQPYGPDSGSAWLFDATTGEQLVRVQASDGAEQDRFAADVALTDDLGLIGAPGHDNPVKNGGAFYLFGAPIADDLTITPTPLIGDANGTFTLRNLRPSDRTWMLYSVRGTGPGIWVKALGIIVDIDEPEIAWGPVSSTADGTLEVTARMPVVGATVPVWFQGVQEVRTTNVVATSIVEP